jgi:hypothetical protein
VAIEPSGGDVPAEHEPKKAISKRIRRGLCGLGVAVVIGVGYLIFWLRENDGHSPAYGDVATWLTFVAAAVGIPFAIYQFVLQRRQLAEQAKTIKEEFARQQKRDELLDAQLDQARADRRVLIRAQAEKVDLMFAGWESPISELTEEGDREPGKLFHLARVINNSSRPIRDVRCRLKKDHQALSNPATRVGKYEVFSPAQGLRGMSPKRGEAAALIRPGDEYGFVFDTKLSDAPDALMSVTFTDDAGTRWRIDHNLHLQQDSDVGAFL